MMKKRSAFQIRAIFILGAFIPLLLISCGNYVRKDAAGRDLSGLSTNDLTLVAYIDCGFNDHLFGYEASGGDSGRIHFGKTYTQAADVGGWGFDNYFSYEFRLPVGDRDLMLLFLDADNATRTYKIIVNDIYTNEINHAVHTANRQYEPGTWKEYRLLIPRSVLRGNSMKLLFEHRGMENYPPAISDIWIYSL